MALKHFSAFLLLFLQHFFQYGATCDLVNIFEKTIFNLLHEII